ncbi:hypothetical protein GQ44DRAFT_719839 [Phaeosphaeriaceae sp. PMI808]|nr:hypothetical protein GQ44DRAFT_719839 [Phaeosphaeriaceae sp. PMI808]
MIRPQIFIGIAALLAGSDVQASKLYARDCSFTWPAYEGDTCETMANNWSISEAEFLSYNPGAVCSALEAGKEYCVEWSGTPPNGPPTPTPIPVASSTRSTLFTSTIRTTPVSSTVRSSTPITTSPSPTPSGACKTTPVGVVTPSPIQTGLVCGCTKFYRVISGDGCWAIANANGITLDDFYAWNPATANECKNLQPDTYVCIGKGTAVTTTPRPTSTGPFIPPICTWDGKIGQYICPTGPVTQRPTTTTTRPTTTTTIRNPPPGPTQTGIPSNCNKWVLQKDGIYCYDMAAAAGITLDRLYALNSALKGDCTGLWPGYAYCIGTS